MSRLLVKWEMIKSALENERIFLRVYLIQYFRTACLFLSLHSIITVSMPIFLAN